MAGEDQYIHPIIQAMAQLQQGMLAKQQLAQNLSQQQAEQANRQKETQIAQQRADQAEKQLENEAEFHRTTLEQQHQIQQAQIELQKMQTLKDLRDLSASGVDPTAALGNGTGNVSLPGLGLNIPSSAIPNQQQLLNTQVQQAGALASAQQAPRTQAEKDLETIREKFETGQLTAKQAFDQRINAANIASREKVAKLSEGSQYAIAKMRTDAEYGTPEEQTNQMGAYQTGLATGELQPNMTNPIERRGTTAFIDNGGRIPSKEDAAAFGHLGQLNDVYKKMEAVQSMLPDEQKLGINSAVADAATMKQLNKLPIQTDAKEALDELAPQLQTVVRNTQQTTGTRFNPQEMQSMQNLLNGIKTKQQAQRAEQSVKNTMNGLISNSLEVGMPQHQQDIIYQRKGVTPKWIIDAENQDKLNPKGHAAMGNEIDVVNSINQGKPVWTDPSAPNYDPQTGQVQQ